MTRLHTILIALVLAVATAGAGCLGALTGDDPEPASTDGDGNDTGTDGGAGDDGTGGNSTLLNEPPTAEIRITNDQDPTNVSTRGFKGEVLKFSAENSTDADGFITNWTWTVIEPTGEAGAPNVTTRYGEVVPGVQFTTEGVKIVTLTVTDDRGESASASTTYYRDVSYSYGGEMRWGGLPPDGQPIMEPVTETREHKVPVIAGAAGLAASIQIDGAQAEVALLDPEGNEHVTGVTETDNVTIVMDHGAPAVGEWTIRVTVTYEPAGACLPNLGVADGGCHPESPVMYETTHEAAYGLQGVVWYGEMPAEASGPGDGHDHEH